VDKETRETSDRTTSGKARPPLDVRIAAYLLYVGGSLQLALTFLLMTPVALPGAAHRVFLGAVTITTNTAEAVYLLCMAACNLVCAWGLMRYHKWAWWFTVTYSIYYSTDAALILPNHQLSTAITFAINAALIAWLWFRRELYGVRLGASHTRK